MEDVVNGSSADWRGRSVLVTGHTGFKGGWLTLWLHRLGAKVHGYALHPPTKPALFEVARVAAVLASDMRADLGDLAQLKSAFSKAQPEVVFHLAAQPLVRESYRDPLGTLASNVMGTAHVLEAARAVDSVRAIANLCGFVFAAFFTYQSFASVAEMYRFNQGAEMIDLPYWPFALFMGLCGVILTVRFALEVSGCVPEAVSAVPAVEESI